MLTAEQNQTAEGFNRRPRLLAWLPFARQELPRMTAYYARISIAARLAETPIDQLISV